MPPFTVVDVHAGNPALEAFLALSDDVYRGDPLHLPTAKETALAGLARPEFAGRQQLLLATGAGGFPVARLAARLSPALTGTDGRPLGMIGFFEALPGEEAAEAARGLLAAATSWLREQGAGEIVGPMEGDTWHRYRLNVGPWNEPPFLLEPQNPAYYPPLWEAAGYVPLERYLSKWCDSAEVAGRLADKAARAEAAGYRLRRLDLSRFDEELATIYRLSCRVFAGNFLYTEIPEAEFLALYRGTRRLLDPDFVWFAESPGGEAVGFLFAYPDRVRAAVAARRGRPLAALGWTLHHRFLDRGRAVDFKTLGVLAEHRRAGLAAALFHRGHQAAARKGYRRANHCLFREGNPSGDLGGEGILLRRYLLYKAGEAA